MRRFAILAVAIASLAGCASGPPRPGKAEIQRIDRMLSNAPGKAQPSVVVAAEMAFARSVREDGAADARREFAAMGASEPSMALASVYDTKTVWISCDGTLAITRGQFETPQGEAGTYVTTWQWQTDRSYRWIAHDMMRDAAAERRLVAARDVDPDDGAIVVEGTPTVEGIVSECIPSTEGPVLDPAMQSGASRKGAMTSADYTLRTYCDEADGVRTQTAWYLENAQWTQALELAVPTDERC